jgi:isopentenyldiphosphate isomerase
VKTEKTSLRRRLAAELGVEVHPDGSGLMQYDRFSYNGVKLEDENFRTLKQLTELIFKAGEENRANHFRKCLGIPTLEDERNASRQKDYGH